MKGTSDVYTRQDVSRGVVVAREVDVIFDEHCEVFGNVQERRPGGLFRCLDGTPGGDLTGLQLPFILYTPSGLDPFALRVHPSLFTAQVRGTECPAGGKLQGEGWDSGE